jgi:hypothetical protein
MINYMYVFYSDLKSVRAEKQQISWKLIKPSQNLILWNYFDSKGLMFVSNQNILLVLGDIISWVTIR